MAYKRVYSKIQYKISIVDTFLSGYYSTYIMLTLCKLSIFYGLFSTINHELFFRIYSPFFRSIDIMIIIRTKRKSF